MSAQTNEKDRGWLLPVVRKQQLAAGLYLVATPIGNLRDITLRALDVLGAADLVVCEDTRVTGKLLEYYGLKKNLLPYNDHNAAGQRGPILEKLKNGQIIAMVSDAGTPLVSDPGFKLVRECVEKNIFISSVPGANSVLTALQLSALPADAFCFAGFLPPKDAGRKKALEEWKNVPATLIFFETAPRLEKSLRNILEVLGDRDIAITRELTKLFEEVRRMKVSEAIEVYKDKPPKGEIVLVIGPGAASSYNDADIQTMLKKALKTMSTKEAASLIAKQTGRPRKEIYNLALKMAKK